MATAPQLTSKELVLARTSCTRAGGGGFSRREHGGEARVGLPHGDSLYPTGGLQGDSPVSRYQRSLQHTWLFQALR